MAISSLAQQKALSASALWKVSRTPWSTLPSLFGRALGSSSFSPRAIMATYRARRCRGSTASTASREENREQSRSPPSRVRNPHSMMSMPAWSSFSRMAAMVSRPNRQLLI